MELTVFTGCCRYPPEGELAKLWHDNKMALTEMLKMVNQLSIALVHVGVVISGLVRVICWLY